MSKYFEHVDRVRLLLAPWAGMLAEASRTGHSVRIEGVTAGGKGIDAVLHGIPREDPDYAAAGHLCDRYYLDFPREITGVRVFPVLKVSIGYGDFRWHTVDNTLAIGETEDEIVTLEYDEVLRLRAWLDEMIARHGGENEPARPSHPGRRAG